MIRESLSLGLAEVCVAFVGFSAIAVILGRRATGEWTEVDHIRFSGLVVSGIQALVLCVIPLVLWEFVQSEEATLRVTSGIAALITAWAIVRGARQAHRAAPDPETSIVAALIFLSIYAILMVGLAITTIGIGGWSLGIYVATALAFLAHSALMFLRLVTFR